MGKGANKNLLSNSGVGQSEQGQLSGSGAQLSNFLTPTLESQVTNPQGYTPQQMAYMNTASQQSLGGSTAGVTGLNNLEAARTRNAGGFQGAEGTATRNAEQQLSQNAVGIQAQQANLQQQQRAQALQALQSLYGMDEQTALSYLNSSNSALNAENTSTNNMDKNLTSGLLGAGELGLQAYKTTQGKP